MARLTLGPIEFEDFELPGRIVFGGRQRLAVHQMPGGGRVIDTLGRDDAPLAWRGAFSGPAATERALALDLLRAEGAPWPIAWDEFGFIVVIAEFSASYERSNWIPYRIVCSVVADETAVLAGVVLSLAEALLSDLAVAGGLAGLDTAAASAAINGQGGLAGGSIGQTTAGIALAALAGSVEAGIASAGMVLQSPAGFSESAGAARQAAQLAGARGYVRRARANLANSGS